MREATAGSEAGVMGGLDLKAALEGHVPKHGLCQWGTIKGFKKRSVNQICMFIFSKLIDFYYLFGCAASSLLSMGFLKL